MQVVVNGDDGFARIAEVAEQGGDGALSGGINALKWFV
jgi:hypothetical protein